MGHECAKALVFIGRLPQPLKPTNLGSLLTCALPGRFALSWEFFLPESPALLLLALGLLLKRRLDQTNDGVVEHLFKPLGLTVLPGVPDAPDVLDVQDRVPELTKSYGAGRIHEYCLASASSFAVGTWRTCLLGSLKLTPSASSRTVRIVLPSLVAATLCPRCSSALNSACSRRKARGRVVFETLTFSRGSLLSA